MLGRVALVLATLLSLFILTSAYPVAIVDGQLLDLEKRLTHTGRGTWFHPGLGHCGRWNSDNDPILAIGERLYDRNNGGNCNQWVEIVDTQNGKKVYAQTQDSCESCSDNDIDMSPAVFKMLAPLDTGEITVSWHFMSKEWKP